MTKPAIISPDPLVMKVRAVLRSTEPRPAFVNPHSNQYGTELVDCPVCGESCREMAYNHHFTYYHGTRFWKELAIIELLKKELS